MEGCFVCGKFFEDGALEIVECMSESGEFEERTICDECLEALEEKGEES